MDTGPMGPRRGEPARTVVTGPLAPYARGWRAELAARGYAPDSMTALAKLVSQVSGWLAATGGGEDALTGEVVREYALARRAAGYQNRTTERAVAPLLGYLRGLRAAPPLAAPVPSTPAEVVVGEFCDYLASEQGLAAGTVHHHRRFAWLFLTELGLSGEADLAGLTAAADPSLAVSQAQRRSPGDMRSLVSALRSLLRFFDLTGRAAHPPAAPGPSVPGWQPAPRPRRGAAGEGPGRGAGIEPFGPQRLRHAVACDLLADGASLTEIGQLLRHHSQRATAIYANPRELHQTGEVCAV